MIRVQMDVGAHYESLAKELLAVRDRVRNVIGASHWQTHGEWRESVLRSILRRHVPSTLVVGRGFVAKPSGTSRQIDVLIYHSSAPVLFRDSDLVIISPDAVRAIVEVKSTIASGKMGGVLRKIADNAEFVLSDVSVADRPLFTGLFVFEHEIADSNRLLRKLQEASRGNSHRVITHLALGESHFVKFWKHCPRPDLDHAEPGAYCHWHCYNVDRRAAGYFLGNMVATVASVSVQRNEDLWFPAEGKEFLKIAELPFSPDNSR